MTIEQLREFHVARLFRPFDIHLADGQTFAVVHPEQLAPRPPVAPSGLPILMVSSILSTWYWS
jgi:hypothetical protein